MNDTIEPKSDTIDIGDDTVAKECLYCGQRFTTKSSKAKFCSEACKQRAKRIKQMDAESGEPQTVTDKLFSAHRPGYYKFSDTVRDEKCLQCGKKFSSSLVLLKTCSPECYTMVLRRLTGEFAK